MNYLITGALGFIGYNLAKSLLEDGHRIFGIDNKYPDYNKLYQYRFNELYKYTKYTNWNIDISNSKELEAISLTNIDYCIHLAAKTGVRESFRNPSSYFDANITGFFNILELVKKTKWPLIYASSSSVYGGALNYNTDNQTSFYAATKRTNEVMASAYDKTYDLNITGLRFFTVYGPAGRPDMAIWKFVENISKGLPIDVVHDVYRDFTYIDDVVGAIKAILFSGYNYTHRAFDIGNGYKTSLEDIVFLIQDKLYKNPIVNYIDKPNTDVWETRADPCLFRKIYNYECKININDGLNKFIKWYKEYEDTDWN